MRAEHRESVDDESTSSVRGGATSVAPSPRRHLRKLVLLVVAAAFVLLNLWRWWDTPGDDLSSTYIAARLLAHGRAAHLYSHHPTIFHIVGDPVWKEEALRGGFTSLFHPYVQIPLWAAALQPLALRVPFETFNRLFLVVHLLAAVITVWLVARMWNRRLLERPWQFALVLVVLSASEPFRYGGLLNQTTFMIVGGLMGAVYLASRPGRAPLAGLLLSIVAVIKLTPGIVAIYWLLTGRRRAFAWFALCMLVWCGLSVLVVGVDANLAFVHRLSDIGRTTLVSYNNQSLLGWLLRDELPFGRTFGWIIWQTPPWARHVNQAAAAVVLLATAFAVWRRTKTQADPDALGISMLVLMTLVFPPIAWTHYYVALVIPLLVLHAELRAARSPTSWVLFGAIVALNLQPIALPAQPLRAHAFGDMFLWSHLFSAVLAMAALIAAEIRPRPLRAPSPDPAPPRASGPEPRSATPPPSRSPPAAAS